MEATAVTTILDRMIVIGVLSAVVVAPWLFGAVEFYARTALALWLLVLLLLWSLKAAGERQWILQLTPIHGILLAFVLAAVIQSVPLGFLRSSSSFSSGADALPVAETVSLSLDPVATRRAAVTVATLVGYFFLATHFLRSRRRVRAAVVVVILLGFSLALVGVMHKLTSNGKLLWFREVDAIEVAFGPYVNRNHFAGFIEMIFPLPLALIVARGVDREKWILYGFLTVALGTAMVVSASRGALVVLAAELAALPVLLRWMGRHEETTIGEPVIPREGTSVRPARFTVRDGAVALMLLAGISLGVVWIGAEPVVSRFSSASGADGALSMTDAPAVPADPLNRPAIWRTTVRMIRHHLLTGVGLGAFPLAYTRYDEATGLYRVEQAHNDYLQIIADAGVVGACLLLAFLCALIRTAAAALTFPPARERAVALGATLGCWGMAIHSLFDFNLQVPANALLFLLLIAVLTVLGSTEWSDRR
jgi:O-antigen ligase